MHYSKGLLPFHPSHWLSLSFFGVLSLLAISCSSSDSQHAGSFSNKDAHFLSSESKSAQSECNHDVSQALGLTQPHSSGLPVISTEAGECAEMALSGDERCQSLGQQVGLTADLIFFSVTDGKETYCGCRCADPEPPVELYGCAAQLDENFEGTHFENYPITPDGLLIISRGDQCGIASPKRCDNLDSTANMALTWVVTEYNGEIVCGCQCSNAGTCSTDENTETAAAYHYYGQGTPDMPFRIHTGAQLFSISRNVGALDKNYELCKDIDLHQFYGSTSGAVYFAMGGDDDLPFTGSFQGNNHTISNYRFIEGGPHYAAPPIYAQDVPGVVVRNSLQRLGLFGKAVGANIQNLQVTNVNIVLNGAHYAGGLLGRGSATMIQNVGVTGNIQGGYSGYGVGGLVGGFDGIASQLNASTKVTVGGGGYESGGLIGHFYSGEINGAHVTGNVSGRNAVGGLIGLSDGTVNNVYASGYVSGNNYVGGLIGDARLGSVNHAYATGHVSGSGNYVGGLTGANATSVINAYATGSVLGSGNFVGGLMGKNSGPVNNAYATGSILGSNYVGGLVGHGAISNAFALNVVVSGITNVGPIVGFNTSSTNNNLHFWSGASCTGTPCIPTNNEVPHADQSDFYDPMNAPMNVWAAPWIFSGTGLPTLP